MSSVPTDDGPATATPATGSEPRSVSRSAGAEAKPALSGPALWTAIGAVLVWVGFSILALFFVGRSETEWTRVAWVFGSIQAIAFAAAGALFGTTVQQQNVASAQRQAAAATQDADQQREIATRGRALAATIQAEGAVASRTGGEDQRTISERTPAAGSADEVRQRHAALATVLFGEIGTPG